MSTKGNVGGSYDVKMEKTPMLLIKESTLLWRLNDARNSARKTSFAHLFFFLDPKFLVSCPPNGSVRGFDGCIQVCFFLESHGLELLRPFGLFERGFSFFQCCVLFQILFSLNELLAARMRIG